jgi:hypothetical protein
MIRSKIAGAALLATLTAASLAWADEDRHAKPDRDRGRDMADFSAMHAAFCKDGYAREVGRLAYLEVRLSLSAPQQPLFAAWRDAVLEQAQSRANECASAPAPDRSNENLMTREEKMETRLKARLASLEAQKPSLAALYQSLTDEQKKMLDHAGHRRDGRPRMMERDEKPGDRHAD